MVAFHTVKVFASALLSVTVLTAAANPLAPKIGTVANAQPAHNISSFPRLIEASIDDLQQGLDQGLFTSVELVKAYVSRIWEVNATLHMVAQINPDAIAIAEKLDAERKAGKCRGPLHGIPILIKNNIATDDKMDNTAGSYALVGAKVPRDSTMAAKLRKAGAIILGKTNLSQWANYRSDNTTNGWSATTGQTVGAYYPGQDPSGSSSGSGVSSALGLAGAALGTETDGSILSPSDVNNLAAVKPSVGLTSRYLVIPISEHQDTVGPMARYVKDAARLLTAIAGKDSHDNYTSAIPFKKVPKYVEACKLDALKGKRIGIPRNYIDLTGASYLQPVVDTFNANLDVIRDAGATIVDNITLPGYNVLVRANFPNVVLEADFLVDLPNYLKELTYNPNNITDVASLRAYTQANPLEDYPMRDTGVWDDALSLGFDNTSPEFWSNYTADLYYAGPLGITGALKNYSLDALIVPTAFSPFLPALIGSPVVTVPLGKFAPGAPVFANSFGTLNETGPNLPFGLSFMGKRFDEYNLIGYAYAFEQRTMVRNTISPIIQPTTEIRDVVDGGKNGAKNGARDVEMGADMMVGRAVNSQAKDDVKGSAIGHNL